MWALFVILCCHINAIRNPFALVITYVAILAVVIKYVVSKMVEIAVPAQVADFLGCKDYARLDVALRIIVRAKTLRASVAIGVRAPFIIFIVFVKWICTTAGR